ncbi:hypothetical protein KCP74_13780 [Salmonella enterica subsp. enterica]|nr:hypothetical protein KCP74_13780 [Salmonella enterica subsp. enterica]
MRPPCLTSRYHRPENWEGSFGSALAGAWRTATAVIELVVNDTDGARGALPAAQVSHL